MIRDRMSRTKFFLLVATALALPACDTKDDEELRAMMGDVAAGHVDGLKDEVAELESTIAAQNEKIAALSTKVDEIGALEEKLAAADARITALEAVPEVPPTPVAPPVAGRPDPAETYKVTLDDAQTKGPDTALVTVVIFSDFQCPYCARVNPTLEQIGKDYGSDVRFAFKHNPLSFHAQAMPAALAAEAAGEQGKFWEMHDKLFAHQKDLNDKNFEKWAKEIGIDVTKFKAAVKDPATKKRVEAHQAAGTAIGARGTPAFFINGRFLSGAQPLTSFKALIDAELKEAEALVAGGTSRSGVYDAVIAYGKTSV
jgi:protein-disulfide isomerase